MDQAWGRARASELLDRGARCLDTWGEPKHANRHLVREIAHLSLLEGFSEPRRIAERVLSRDKTLVPGYSRLDQFFSRFVPWRRAQLEKKYPRYVGDIVLRFVERAGASSIEGLTLARRFDDVEARIASDFDWQLYAATRAVMGDVEGALVILEREAFPADRRRTVRLVSCVESFRRGDGALAARLLTPFLAEEEAVWSWTQLARGFVGRVPWGGYPFDDY